MNIFLPFLMKYLRPGGKGKQYAKKEKYINKLPKLKREHKLLSPLLTYILQGFLSYQATSGTVFQGESPYGNIEAI